MSIFDDIVSGVRFIAYYEDFDGDVDKWKFNFYEIWRYEMTWGFAYSIKLHDSRSHGVFIDVIVKEAYKDQFKELLEYVDYKNIRIEDVKIGEIWGLEHDDCDDIEFASIEY